MLFVPGDRPDLAAKTLRCQPDLVVIDLEDAVPAHAKTRARSLARDAAIELMSSVPVCVRINPSGTEWFDDDVASLPSGLTAVVVPKWDSALPFDIPVVAGIETVRGVANAQSLLGGPVIGCYFGAEDYIADLGGVRTEGNVEVLYARSAVGIAARLAGIPALDMVTVNFADLERFTREAAVARSLGFRGKLCIHPGQVPAAHKAFSPTAAEVDRAARLVAAFEAAHGATIAFDGQMVDEVIVRQARAVLDGQTLPST